MSVKKNATKTEMSFKKKNGSDSSDDSVESDSKTKMSLNIYI